jgi:hypothetical protein
MERQCGTCTKCCDGSLIDLDTFGHSVNKLNPCHFLNIGVGCGIYKNRPQSPCIDYKCMWLMDEVPEWMKPSEANVIVDKTSIEEIEYLCVTPTTYDNSLSEEVIDWIFEMVEKGHNVKWKHYRDYWAGSNEFCQKMNYPSKQEIEEFKDMKKKFRKNNNR